MGASGLCLVLVTGCRYLETSRLRLEAYGDGDRVLAGSLESVSRSTQASLSESGLLASTTRNGDTVRIESKSRSGYHFTLILTREKSNESQQTRVHIEWKDGKDEQEGFQILSQLETSKSR
jgi:hypothetical protein